MIHFNKATWQNFLSFGNEPTTLDFNDCPSHTLIIGGNGGGKSTILDILCFGLFGKAFRKVNKSNLINSVNEEGLLVTLDFAINGHNYIIKRGMKPGILQLFKDGIEKDQDCSVTIFQKYIEDNVLKTDMRTFTQIVILGSANFTPFMRMKMRDRRDVIEDILGIRVFSGMNVLLKDHAKDHRNTIDNLKKDVVRDKDKLSFLQEQINLSVEETSTQIEVKKGLIVSLRASHDIHQKNLDDISYDDRKVIPAEQQTKIEYYSTRIESNLAAVESDIEFYKENDVCSKCNQAIEPDFKATSIESLLDKQIKFTLAIDDLETKRTEIKELIENITKHNLDVDEWEKKEIEIKVHIEHVKEQIFSLVEEIEALQETQDKKLEVQDTSEIEFGIVELERDIKLRTDNMDIMILTLKILRDDGAKTMIIDYYLPIINQLIQKYLELFDFNTSFEFDSEFNEKIKSRFCDTYSYFNFSEGEKARIDIALLFTWRELAKKRNSVSTNLLLLDELFDGSLDAIGLTDMKAILEELSDKEKVFVISHREELQDQFSNSIRCQKTGNFSRYEYL